MGYRVTVILAVIEREEIPNPEPTLLKPDLERQLAIRVARINSPKEGELSGIFLEMSGNM